MGTPDFAVCALQALIDAGENIVSVVTQPDKVQGRGYKLTPSPVKVCAESHGIPVLTPNTLRGEEFASVLAEIDPELIVVAAYGKILPHNVLAYPKYGCINIHGSLLPEYRGAAPMQRAIIDGKKVTGITTMMMDDGLDTGDMLQKCEIPIGPDDDFEVIHDRMAAAGAELLLSTLASLRDGTLTRIPQADSPVTPNYAAKIEKTDCIIDFSKSAQTIHDQVRGLCPIPLAFTHTPDGKLLKVLRTCPDARTDFSPARVGEVVALDGGKITVACGENGTGRIEILRVLPEGKGRMDAADFIRGRKIAQGDVLA